MLSGSIQWTAEKLHSNGPLIVVDMVHREKIGRHLEIYFKAVLDISHNTESPHIFALLVFSFFLPSRAWTSPFSPYWTLVCLRPYLQLPCDQTSRQLHQRAPTTIREMALASATTVFKLPGVALITGAGGTGKQPICHFAFGPLPAAARERNKESVTQVYELKSVYNCM